MRDSNQYLPAIEELIPHRGTMLLLDRVLAFDDELATAEYVPRCDAWYADSFGNMPAWVGIELMAQTIAAHIGLIKRREGNPKKMGALVGARRYTSTRSTFPSGRALRINAKMTFRDGSGLAAYKCEIFMDEAEMATSVLKVFEPDNFETFLGGNRL
jgi:predicted hotdog family 3-hydroxylacyl-ACP dehydratase